MKRSGKSGFERPSMIQSVNQRGWLETAISRPVAHTHRSSIQRIEPTAASVGGLFFRCLPRAVVFAVRAVVVQAFNAVVGRWPGAHVSDEDCKVRPLWSDSDAATAIQGKSVVGGSIASASDVRPRPVFARIAAGQPVRSVMTSQQALPVETAAGFRRSRQQFTSGGNVVSAAVALAQAFASMFGERANHKQASEPLSVKYWSCHGRIIPS
jgi:hypothetical protein